MNYNINKQLIRNIFEVIPLLLALGIYLGFTNAYLCISLLFLRILFIGKNELSIFLILFGTVYFGFLFSVFSIPIPGAAVSLFLGLIIIRNKLIGIYKKYNRSFKFLLMFFLIFSITYLYGPKTEYSNEKLMSIIYVGIISLFAFLAYTNTANISNRDLAQLLLLVGISYIVFGIEFYSFSKPSHFFDFTFFRSASTLLEKKELQTIGYHLPALTVLYGFTFWLSSAIIRKKEQIFLFIYTSTTLLIILMSGTRQALVGFVAVILFKLLFLDKKNRFKKYFSAIVFSILILSILTNTDSEYIDRSIESNTMQGMLNRDYVRTFDIISNNSIWGVGLGGFYVENINKSKYPHNIVLEIICESGFVGLILCAIIIWLFLRNKKNIIQFKTSNNSFVFLLIVAYGVRAMISEDLGANIALISLILTIAFIDDKNSIIKNQKNELYNNYST